MKTVSIHQPNYLPWLGYFDKICKSDVFVVFDDVQFPRGKQHFGHRNLIKSPNGESKWLTVTLKDKNSLKNFNEVELSTEVDWKNSHLNLIKSFYRKTRYFDKYFSLLESILTKDFPSLSHLNVAIIKEFLNVMDIHTQIVFSSDICKGNGLSGNEKILFILKSLEADRYVSGTGEGSMRYINESEFKNNNIELVWQHYEHPVYDQIFPEKGFLKNLCFLDLLFVAGENSRKVLEN